jgi:hypothetical protein
VHHEHHDIFLGKLHKGNNFENPKVYLILSLISDALEFYVSTKIHGTSIDVMKPHGYFEVSKICISKQISKQQKVFENRI